MIEIGKIRGLRERFEIVNGEIRDFLQSARVLPLVGKLVDVIAVLPAHNKFTRFIIAQTPFGSSFHEFVACGVGYQIFSVEFYSARRQRIGFYVDFLLKVWLRQNVVSAPYKHPDNVFFYKFVIPHAEFVRVKGRGVLKKREESGRLYSAAGVARVDVDFCFQCKFFHIRLKAMPYPARPSPRRYRL